MLNMCVQSPLLACSLPDLRCGMLETLPAAAARRTEQLTAQYGDILYRIQDLESSIATELIKRLLHHAPALGRGAAALAELDCLASFALCSR